MKLERLTNNKIKIFLTLDDLIDRGITKEDILGNSLKVHKLFQDMVEEACEELSFKMSGSIAIEIFSLPAQGLIIIVTKEEEELLTEEEEFLDLQVKIDDFPHILYVFNEFEDIVQLSHRLSYHGLLNSTLYHYEGRYYLLIENVKDTTYDTVISLAAEYGHASTLTLYRINEYGTCIIEKEAIHVLISHFN
ncbi:MULTISPECIES: genetic competence negative regulator [Peribacillus]|uniref:genetic competence negative regulator n=1 Tax=Peribacillus TaxID=2675229 RepID=UPI001911D92E|nr:MULTISPECIES: genetic competence negative regulator [unclassified Peribacillus]MBK5442386.1 genetic competence negative regulator [Peribacillus sp. TH24]MBK5462864.1 genetic competence negative regulator [Peribacillus sp. TH27]MBK5483795.1 genetic competence negative regulator [Peribacillus sp. TH16]MBK5501047.1 genetic competence negative regulator [Peribacillus sp. TH14]WMX53983.1 genetic competence negative regulator [Peribacillus sp. R9-11]